MILNKLKHVLTSKIASPVGAAYTAACIHTGYPLFKAEDRKQMLASVPKKDEGTVGEKAIAIDSLITK